MLIAAIVQFQTEPPSWWFALTAVVLLCAGPVIGWVAQTPARRRIVGMLVVALVAGVGLASASTFDLPCCEIYVPYGICWPFDWGC